MANIDQIVNWLKPSLSVLSYDLVPRGVNNQFHSDTENQLINKINIEVRLEYNKKYQARIDAALVVLNKTELSIIRDFYFKEESWVYIGQQVSISQRQCQRIRDVALDKMSIAMFGSFSVIKEYV